MSQTIVTLNRPVFTDWILCTVVTQNWHPFVYWISYMVFTVWVKIHLISVTYNNRLFIDLL